MTVVFETERMQLRPWAPEDAVAFHGIWGDPRVIFWGDTTADLEAAAERLRGLCERSAEMPDGQGWWAAADKATGEIVGNVFLQPAKYADGVELGYHFAYEAWGRGLATEAAKGAVGYAFRVLGVSNVSAPVLPDNARSQRVVEKAGFVKTRQLMHADLLHDFFEQRNPG